MYSRLQLLLQVSDNPEHCPAKANVDLEVEVTAEDLDIQDVPVSPFETPGTEVPCYRGGDLFVIVYNPNEDDVTITLHNGIAPIDVLVPAGRAVGNYHDGTSAGSVFVKAGAGYEGTVRVLIT